MTILYSTHIAAAEAGSGGRYTDHSTLPTGELRGCGAGEVEGSEHLAARRFQLNIRDSSTAVARILPKCVNEHNIRLSAVPVELMHASVGTAVVLVPQSE